MSAVRDGSGDDIAAAWAAEVLPGAEAVGVLARLDPAGLSPAGRVDALVGLERQIAWLQARQQDLLVAMAGTARTVDEIDKDWVRDEVACALHLPPVTAGDRLSLARALHRRPATLGLLRAGLISLPAARLLAETLDPLPDDVAAVVEADVLGQAPQQTVAALRRTLTREVLRHHPAEAERRHHEAVADRRVYARPAGDGMAELHAYAPAPDITLILNALNATAHQHAADERTADQRRMDALTHLARCALAGQPATAPTPGARPALAVTVALSTLLTLDQQPAELQGHGPIPAVVARQLASDPTATWRLIPTNPDGRPVPHPHHNLDHGRATYRPPAALARFITTRDQTCVFPGCHRSATRCDLDHRTPWSAGGTTSPDNLHTLCPRHHHLKHEARWTVTATPDGATIWTTPTGHTYTRPPATLPNDTTTKALAPPPRPTPARPREQGSTDPPS